MMAAVEAWELGVVDIRNSQYSDVVLALNQYYLRLGLITRKRRDIEHLRLKAAKLDTEISRLLEVGPTLRTVPTYGGECVQSSPEGDPLGRAHCEWEDRLIELREKRFETLDEARLLEQQIWELQCENAEMEIALGGLTLLQRQVVEQRHKYRRRTEKIGQMFNYSQQHISRIYVTALGCLRDKMYPTRCVKIPENACYYSIIR